MPKIKFVYLDKYFYDVCERPRPSSAHIPKWFKEMPQYFDGSDSLKIRPDYGYTSNASAKKCTPMLDGITGGYTVPLWSDVYIRQGSSGPEIMWRVEKDVFALHGPSSEKVGPPLGFGNKVFKYLTWFRIETPPGYSTIIRPPAGHYDLPFQVIPAIVDTDKSIIDSNLPLWVRDGFEGIVEKGTPIAQVIPFKRESWSSEFSWIDYNTFISEKDKGFNSTIRNNYIKNIWSRKKFV
jgi:hypothetical protein